MTLLRWLTMPAPIESPKTLIAVRNLAREKIEICGTWLVGEIIKVLSSSKLAFSRQELLTQRRERERVLLKWSKMVGNYWGRKCWQPIKEPVNREDYGNRFTWKPNLTEGVSIHFDDTLRLLIFSNIQSFDLVLDQLTVSRTITIVTSPAYKKQLFIRDLEFSYFFAFQSVCIWNC